MKRCVSRHIGRRRGVRLDAEGTGDKPQVNAKPGASGVMGAATVANDVNRSKIVKPRFASQDDRNLGKLSSCRTSRGNPRSSRPGSATQPRREAAPGGVVKPCPMVRRDGRLAMLLTSQRRFCRILMSIEPITKLQSQY